METYLVIIMTVLVLTQVIRLIQNTISLVHHNAEIKKTIQWYKDRDISEVDFDTQRECFYLLKEYLLKLKDAEEKQDGEDFIVLGKKYSYNDYDIELRGKHPDYSFVVTRRDDDACM